MAISFAALHVKYLLNDERVRKKSWQREKWKIGSWKSTKQFGNSSNNKKTTYKHLYVYFVSHILGSMYFKSTLIDE